jgi:type 1 glutamine amidotransferase
MLSPRRDSIRMLLAVVAAFGCCAAVGSLASAADPPRPLRVLLVLGGCCHDYAAQQEALTKGLAARAHVEIVVAYDPDKSTKHLNPVYEQADWATGLDAVIHDECSADVKDLAIIDRILEPHRQGLPAVVLHCGMHSYRSEGYPQAVTPWFEFTGLQSTGHGRQAPIDIEYVTPANPLTASLQNWTTINEELYNNSSGKLLETASSLARGRQTTKNKDGAETTAEAVVAWTNEYREGTRVFATTLGHNTETVADPRYLDLVARGLLWSCGKLEDDAYHRNPPPE